MIMELYEVGNPYPVRYYKNTDHNDVGRVRAMWIKEVQHLGKEYYIEIKEGREKNKQHHPKIKTKLA